MAQSVSMIHETIELTRRMSAYAIRVAMLRDSQYTFVHTAQRSQAVPVTAFPSARAHDGAACRGATAGGGNAPNLAMLAARNRDGACQYTVPMAGMARKGTDSKAPMIEMR